MVGVTLEPSEASGRVGEGIVIGHGDPGNPRCEDWASGEGERVGGARDEVQLRVKHQARRQLWRCCKHPGSGQWAGQTTRAWMDAAGLASPACAGTPVM